MANYAKYVQDDDAIDYTPSADVAAGQVVVQGDLIGVAKTPIKASTPGALATEGVFDFPKVTGTGSGIAAGATVYWKASDSTATTAANDGGTPPTTFPLLGKATAAAADGDATVRVRLHQ